MYKINDNFQKLPGSYLFSTIAKKVAAYQQTNPLDLSQQSGSHHFVAFEARCEAARTEWLFVECRSDCATAARLLVLG